MYELRENDGQKTERRRGGRPRSEKVARRRDRVRGELLAIAVEKFVGKGAENVAVEEIIEEAGIARSTFYSFFANKEQLIEEITRPVFEQGIEQFEKLNDCNTAELMDGILKTYLFLWERNPAALLLSQYMGEKYFPLVEDLHIKFVEQLAAHLSRLEKAKLLRNGSVEYTTRLLARTAVRTLRIYAQDSEFRSLFMNTMRGQLLK